MTKEELESKPTNTPEEIVALIGNFANQYDLKKMQERQVKAIKEYAAKAVVDFLSEAIVFAKLRAEVTKHDEPPIEMESDKRLDYAEEQKLNMAEEDFGTPWTEVELAKHFNEPPPPEPVPNKLTNGEILAQEIAQDNSNDIYKLSARVKNLARGNGMGLTPMGDVLCNTYTHVLKAFYTFAETISDQDTKDKLVRLIRTHEDMPGNVIAAAGAGVKAKKNR